MSGRAVEAAGRPNPAAGQDRNDHAGQPDGVATSSRGLATEQDVADAAQLASLADETPRDDPSSSWPRSGSTSVSATGGDHQFVPFTATRMSGLDIGPRQIRKGAAGARCRAGPSSSAAPYQGLEGVVDGIARPGSTPLVVTDGSSSASSSSRTSSRRRWKHFAEMRGSGHPYVMITGDNPLTAAAIAQRPASTTSSRRRRRRPRWSSSARSRRAVVWWP